MAAGRAGGLKAGEEAPDQRRAGERARAPIEAKQGLTTEQLSSGFVALYIIVGVGGALLLSALLIAIQQDWNMWLGVSIPAMTFGAIGLAFLRRSPEGGVVLLIACAILGIVIFGLAPG